MNVFFVFIFKFTHKLHKNIFGRISSNKMKPQSVVLLFFWNLFILMFISETKQPKFFSICFQNVMALCFKEAKSWKRIWIKTSCFGGNTTSELHSYCPFCLIIECRSLSIYSRVQRKIFFFIWISIMRLISPLSNIEFCFISARKSTYCVIFTQPEGLLYAKQRLYMDNNAASVDWCHFCVKELLRFWKSSMRPSRSDRNWGKHPIGSDTKSYCYLPFVSYTMGAPVVNLCWWLYDSYSAKIILFSFIFLSSFVRYAF